MACYSWLPTSSFGNYKMMKMNKKNKLSFSTRQPIVSPIHSGSAGQGRFLWFHGCSSKSEKMGFKCFSVKQDGDDFDMDYRLFSNLNQSTFKRDPGSITGSTLLVAGTTYDSIEPRAHKAAKHIERKYHLIRGIVKRGDIIVTQIASEDNRADPFTKSLSAKVFDEHVEAIGVKCMDA